MSVTRRSLLGLGAAGATLLALGGLGLGLQPTVLRAPAAPLKKLDERSFSVLAAIADRVCPGGDGFPTAEEVGVAEAVDALLHTMHPTVAEELEQALLLVENALTGLLFDGRPRTFTASSPEDQDAILASWQTSSLVLRRRVYKAIRGLVAASYYASPKVYAAVGYPGPPDYSGWVAAATPEPASDAEASP